MHVEKFAVPGMPADRSLGIAGSDKHRRGGIVYFTTDVYNVQVNCNTTTPQRLQHARLAIAQAQFNRLNR